MGIAVMVAVAAWFGIDLSYATVVDHKLTKWEAGIERDADGIRQGCQEFTLGDGDTALLMIHGFGDSPQLWSYMAPYFAERGYTCRGILLPGFASEMSVYQQTDKEQWLDKIETELQELRATHKQVYIVAHSLGAGCAIKVMLDNPDAADGLVAYAPLIGVSNERSPVLSARSWFAVFDKMMLFTRVIASAFEPNLQNQDETAKLKVDRFVPRKVFRDMFALLRENEKRAPAFTAPAMMVVTNQDKVVDADKTRQFFDAIASETKEFHHHNQAGHVIPRDQDWQSIAAKTHQFLLQQQAKPEPPPSTD